MTTVAPAIAQLVADPSLISLVYHHEHASRCTSSRTRWRCGR
ncbi:hypothetical protein [Streptomyces sp. Root369]|nr:hypothetical protein [Streptomyces sp. Root369]